MKGFLMLEDGTVFEGTLHGGEKEVVCEAVFTTGMTGYQETVTDPSYEGQAVVMTYPMIGNYGANAADCESRRPWLSALVTRELSRFPSNYRCEEPFASYLERNGVVALSGVDTRSIVRRLREKGTMNCLIAPGDAESAKARLAEIAAFKPSGGVPRVSRPTKEIVTPFANKTLDAQTRRIALLDYGAKQNIVRSLVERGCEVTVWPWNSSSEDILASRPDGIMLSNGPGDPKDCAGILPSVRSLADSGIPLFAICLGHQLLALAAGFDTERMKFGHRGCNHPVKDLETGRVYMSSQNHGYCVRSSSIHTAAAEVSHVNANDGSVEGLRFRNKPVSSVQFHPEASPGPRETAYLFDRFLAQAQAAKESAQPYGADEKEAL